MRVLPAGVAASGAALVDFAMDGMLDLVEVNYGAPVKLWQNVGSPELGNWEEVRLTQPGPNVDAIGAWIEVQIGSKTLRRELTIGGGHAGGQLGWTHFGLGAAQSAQVRVQWPDGDVGAWREVSANQLVRIDRSEAK